MIGDAGGMEESQLMLVVLGLIDVVIHMVFVVSAVFPAWIERLLVRPAAH